MIFSEKKAKSAKIRLAINLKILALIVPVVLGSLFFVGFVSYVSFSRTISESVEEYFTSIVHDISHQLELMKAVKKLKNRGKGIAAVLHDLPLAFAFSDKIAVMKDGKIIALDTPEDLYSKPVMREVFGIELDYLEKEKSYRYKYQL